MLPRPPHWATRRPPGCRVAEQRGEQRVVVVDPVEGGVGEDRVDRLGQRPARPGPGTARSPGRRAPPRRARPSTAPRRPRTRGPRAPGRPASPVTRPEPQPASSTTSSPSSGSRASCSSAQPNWGSETRSYVAASQSRRRPSRPASSASPSRPASRQAAHRGRPGRSRSRSKRPIASPWSSVSAMSSSPFRSRCLISGSISNRAVPPGQRTSCSRRSTWASPASAIAAHASAVELHREQPDLGAVGAEDVGEARRDDGLEAVVLERPGRVLAARAAAEVAPGHQHRVARQLPVLAPWPSRRTGTRRSRSARSASGTAWG